MWIPFVTSLSLAAEPLTVWHAYRGEERRGLEVAAQSWAERSGAQVELVDIPFGAFDSKLETAIPRGNGPDLFVAAHANLGKWVPMQIVTAVPVERAAHLAVTVDALSLEGQVWGVPLAFKSLVLLYDPAKIASPPTTTDELLAMAHANTGPGRYGLAYQAAEPYFAAAWQHAFGARAFAADGQVHLDDEAQIRALAFSKRLAVDEGIAPQQPTAELVTRLYQEGSVAFVVSGPWFVAEVTRPIAAAPLPIVSEAGAPAQPYLTVDAAFVAPGADARAVELALWLGGPEGAVPRSEIGRQAVSAVGVPPADALVAVLTEQAKSAVPMPSDPDVQSVFEAQARALRDVLRGAVTPERAAAEAQQYYAILSKPPPAPVSPVPYVVAASLLAGAWAVTRLRAAFTQRRELWAARWDYGWIAPSLGTLLLLVVAPFVVGASVSLFEHRRGEWSFVGLSNFVDLLLSRDFPVTSPLSFWFTLAVTVLWTASNVALHVGIGFVLALALREPWIRLRPMWRVVLILPWAVPNYITALVWKGMFHAQYGAVNALLGALLGRQGPLEFDWFSSFATSFAANLTTNTWLGFPFMMVVILGALQSVPKDLEEAAELDGASYLERVRHVIWPMVRPALLPAVVLGTIWTFNMFNVVFLVSQGEPNGQTEILVSSVYRWAFTRGNRYGYAAAYALVVFAVLVGWNRLSDRWLARSAT